MSNLSLLMLLLFVKDVSFLGVPYRVTVDLGTQVLRLHVNGVTVKDLVLAEEVVTIVSDITTMKEEALDFPTNIQDLVVSGEILSVLR